MRGVAFRSCILILVVGCAPLSLHAQQTPPPAPSAAERERLTVISAGLRCLVCRGEPLYGSHTVLAQELRLEVRGMMEQGRNDQEIRDILVSRYGDFLVDEAPAGVALFWWALVLLVVVLVGAGVLHLSRRKAERA